MSERQGQVVLAERRRRGGAVQQQRGTWVHLCNGLDPRRDGGMVPSILGMTGALSRLRPGVRIVTPTASRLDGIALPAGLALEGPETDLAVAVRAAEVVHLHGLWQVQTRRGARVARAARVPYVITAHGMAEPWALRHKYWKKRIYLALVEARNLRRASCLHALSRPEISHLRAIAPWTPVGFIPNGVDLGFAEDLPARSVLEAECPELRGKFVLLFFARLHLKKGLDLLAEALGRIAPGRPDLHVLLAGKDDGSWSPFRDRMEQLGLGRRLTYLGHVAGERARQVWAAADAFVLPSYSEGFSMAILEALACRLPCLITTACHFPELAAAGGAVVVPPDAGAVTGGLRELLERTPRERAELGRRGRRLVEQDYTWDRQAERLAAVYRWLSGGGTPPEAVVP
ncbi:MAG TPA: glycosyltransferase [Isosphaeraceae bacterium]|nr:glycosyltransferase [Isosphaeraceae bacterium]